PKAISPDALERVQSFPRQALHAAVLGFKHPGSHQSLRFEAPVPPDMDQLIVSLRG
ncbi:MAG: RNA pseudouridine synthase, partial [Marinovum sp.]|nr:RNA pseudouridine synthase [Marinovum sp.]